MADHFWVIRKFIEEEGQEKGDVSGQQALQSLEMLRDMVFEWRYVTPYAPGLYLLFRHDQDVDYLSVTLKYGDWRQAQNPVWLYADGVPVSEIEPGWWFGPVPFLPDSATTKEIPAK